MHATDCSIFPQKVAGCSRPPGFLTKRYFPAKNDRMLIFVYSNDNADNDDDMMAVKLSVKIRQTRNEF